MDPMGYKFKINAATLSGICASSPLYWHTHYSIFDQGALDFLINAK